MEVWKGKVALVTGASVGIGASIAQDLVKSGMTVVGASRRVQLIEDLAEGLQGEEGRLIARQLDLTKEVDIVQLFQFIDSELGGADVIINNGAAVANTPISEAESEEIRQCFETNVIGLTLCCREALKSMVRRGMKDGHIININSTVGHRAPMIPGARIGVYTASKFAVTATNMLLRSEVATLGLNTRITDISPGVVNTELSRAYREQYPGVPCLEPEDVASAVRYALQVPARVNITTLRLQPTGELM